MSEAGLSNKALARAVRDLSASRRLPVRCDHTAVSRWLAGTQPRAATAALVTEVLSARTGRSLSGDEAGFRGRQHVDERTGLSYPDDAAGSAAALTMLWQADQDERPTIVSAPVVSSAWFEASLHWLVRMDVRSRSAEAGVRVGVADVDRLRATVAAFVEMDDRFGGGHARRALVEYLRSDVAALLVGSYTETTGRLLQREAAEATLLLAWMSYDAGRNGLAQRYFIQALRLAQAAGDLMLAGSVLDAMSHQATFLGRHREAATLARAARQGTAGRATPTLTAHFHAMEARAHAAGGDSAAAYRSLSEAVRLFERRSPGDDPDWISYFNDAELSAEFAHCFRDLERYEDAVTYAQQSATGSARSDFFTSMVLAAGHLGAGDIEQACLVAGDALVAGRALRSARAAEYVAAFRRQLAPHFAVVQVVELDRMAAGHPLWEARSRTG